MRVALVHDWLNGMRGGEKVLEQLCLMYPGAVIHTLLAEPESLSATIRAHEIRTSWVMRLPGWRANYRWYLPLFPSAIESFDLSGFDLVISTSHCVAVGAIAPAQAVNVCYCHTPMRYAWDHFHSYFPKERFGWPLRAAIGFEMSRLRTWDVAASRRPGRIVANSAHVARRIARHWGREASVVPPPVDTAFYTPGGTLGDFHLVVSALVPYKRLDVAVRAFTGLNRPLVVIGTGPERDRLERLAGPTVRFLGWQPDKTVREYYRSARSLVFPGEEDFGITPLEAAACGTPTLAYAAGGALETVREDVNGILFPEQTPDSLIRAVDALERASFDPVAMRRHAEDFAPARFRERMAAQVALATGERARHPAAPG